MDHYEDIQDTDFTKMADVNPRNNASKGKNVEASNLFEDIESDNKESLFSKNTEDNGRGMFTLGHVKKENLFDDIDDDDSLRKSTPQQLHKFDQNAGKGKYHFN